MIVNRRKILKGSSAMAAMAAVPQAARVQVAQGAPLFAPIPGAWKQYEIKTALEIVSSQGSVQAWVPIPAFEGDGWMSPGETTWTSKSAEAEEVRDNNSGASMLHVVWPRSEVAPSIEVFSRFSGRDRAVEVSKTVAAVPLSADRLRHYTAATELLPTDGIVKKTADRITAGVKTDLNKARQIYEWIIDNTFRDPKSRGCGVGDIAGMLKTGNLSGKCADLNALFVGLARASNLPARDLYGIRVAPSAFGYKSLGANSPTITKAQHCRAEVYIDGIGWLPVDPADVRKVVLEEPPGNLALSDPKVVAARHSLFGAWETNWLAYNDAHDVTLPGSKGSTIAFLMYPQAETAEGRLDSLDPETFKYTITARELTT
jgi:transglutaminase-like putative cysteine protease